MEMKQVELVELLQGKKAFSSVCELEWKKLNSGMGKNTCQLLSGYKDFKEVNVLHELFL